MNYLIDTSVIIEYGVEQLNLLLEDSLDKLFISDIILQEMDGHKNSDETKGFNAREFFRTLANAKHSKVSLNDIKLKDGDYLSRYYLENGLELHVIVRNKYNAKDINDSKIIEIAKDYNLNLVTRDIAQSVRATSIGVGVKVLSGDIVTPQKKMELIFELLNEYKEAKELQSAIKEFCNGNTNDPKFIRARDRFLNNYYKALKDKRMYKVKSDYRALMRRLSGNTNNSTFMSPSYDGFNDSYSSRSSIGDDLNNQFSSNEWANSSDNNHNSGNSWDSNSFENNHISSDDIMTNPAYSDISGNIFHKDD